MPTATRRGDRLGDAPVDHAPDAALSPDGRTLVVPDTGPDDRPGGTPSLIDTATGARRAAPVQGRPFGVAVAPTGARCG